jgi:hypothetical protein
VAASATFPRSRSGSVSVAAAGWAAIMSAFQPRNPNVIANDATANTAAATAATHP